jgi:CRP-like cAMP-binding protein
MTLMSEHESVFYGLITHLEISTKEESEALKELSSQFTVRSYEPGEMLWNLDDSEGVVYFVLSGAFAEYLKFEGVKHILRLYRKGKFAFSEDLVLYSKSPDSFARCLVEAKVASIPARIMLPILNSQGLSGRLFEVLISLSLHEYRNSTYELLQTTGVNRINAALEQFPDLLNLIPRSELADYLGISRASLFRSLKNRKNNG